MSTPFKIRFSGFAIQWLRTYDFGLEEEPLTCALEHLKQCPLVQDIHHISSPSQVDAIDSLMFDVRYQERSQLARVQCLPVQVSDSDLGVGRPRTSMMAVNLLLDLSSGFGVFNVSFPQVNAQGNDAYSIEEIGYLTRQWLLPKNDQGQMQRLRVRLPGSNQPTDQYVREVMNFYYLQVHTALWKAVKSDYTLLPKAPANFDDWLDLSREADPVGCAAIKELHRCGFTRSAYPTSSGPLIDVWGMEGIQPSDFNADTFSDQYEAEVAWLFTDGQRTTFGKHVKNVRDTKQLALYIWPNHALYINQHPQMTSIDRANERVTHYGCLDVEIARIMEIVNLQSALLHAFDSFLDDQLEQVSALAESDQDELVRLTERRRKMSHSTRTFDFYNLFHTAYWESLYVRLLEHPHLRIRDATNLVDIKLSRLDEEIQQATFVQERTRHQHEQERELNVLRGLQELGLSNDVQSRALLTINFLVSATASFGITEVLTPWLTSIFHAQPSFQDAYPLWWIALNVLVFALVAVLLTRTSLFMIRRESRIIELEGPLNLPINISRLQSYFSHHLELAYLNLDDNNQSGFVRLQKPHGVLVVEFDHDRIYRYSVFIQGSKRIDPEQIRSSYLEKEIELLQSGKVIDTVNS